jgi:phospholipid N-methyltransferase
LDALTGCTKGKITLRRVIVDVNVSDTRLVTRGSKNHFNKHLFVSGDGEKIYSGDTIEFNVANEIFPYSGTVSTLSGLRVECFNTILNRWVYHNLIV